MDSTFYKLSNDVLFVIFQIVVWKIWFFKDLTEIRFKFLFWIEFDLEAAMWLFPIGPYRFVQIMIWGR
jgi:hypothetical protein